MKILNQITNLFSRRKPVANPNRILVYTDKKGNRWQVYRDPLQMHTERMQALRDAEKFLIMNLSREWLIRHCELIDECINSGNIVSLALHNSNLKVRLELNWSRESLLHFCASYYLLKEEPDNQDQYYYEQKLHLLKTDPDLCSFFLDDVFKRYEIFTEDLKQDFQTYLQRQGIMEIDQKTWNHSFMQSIMKETNSTKPA